MPVHIPGKINVLADQGSRQEPLATDGTLDPNLFGSISLRFSLFPQVDLFASRATSRSSYSFLPALIQRHSKGMPWIVLSTGSISSRYLLFRLLHSCQWLAGRFCSFEGSMVLLAPLALSTVWISELLQRAASGERLPTNKPLFNW